MDRRAWPVTGTPCCTSPRSVGHGPPVPRADRDRASRERVAPRRGGIRRQGRCDPAGPPSTTSSSSRSRVLSGTSVASFAASARSPGCCARPGPISSTSTRRSRRSSRVWRSVACPARHRPAVAYTAHGFHFHEGGRRLPNAAFLFAERMAGRWTDRLVVINDEDEARRARTPARRRQVHSSGCPASGWTPITTRGPR